MKKKFICAILAAVCAGTMLSGCVHRDRPSLEAPVVLTMWHVYGSQTQSPLNTAIDEFNNTLGKENGITINVVSVTSSSAIDKALAASANQEPGAEALPDLFTAYPRVAQIVGTERLLAWEQYFTAQELASFRQEFLEEGYFGTKLLMLPIAKSTEAFYLNQTLFSEFSEQTGGTQAQLQTFDGLFAAANRYYDWSGGAHFTQINDYYHYALVGMKAYGSEFIRDGKLQLTDPAFESIWTPLAKTAIYGGICLDDGYAAARWKTIEIISNIGSTADILYQPDKVIYPDNTVRQIQVASFPYPTFREDTAGAVHRGGGLFAIKSEDLRKNYAAAIFAKWITQQENNLEFVTQAGYLPVTDAAFDQLVAEPERVSNENYRQLYQTASTMIRTYSLYTIPVFNGASDLQSRFEESVKLVLKTAHTQYKERVEKGEDPQVALQALTEASLGEIRQIFSQPED